MRLIPGGFLKSEATSLYEEFTNSLYSSEPNTYLNDTLGSEGIKSNSKTAASLVW